MTNINILNNNKKNALVAIGFALLLTVTIASTSLQQAFAHAHTELAVQNAQLKGKVISVVVGHTGEPTYAARPGVHDGKHNLEVLVSDAATKLPLTGASLKADKYYFMDVQSFNNASSIEDADQIVKNVTISAVFGDSGHYMARQVMEKPGIYGYHIYGNISYFGVTTVPVDTMVFCKADNGNTTKFNSEGWSGGFGCTTDIDNNAFPSHTMTGVDGGDDAGADSYNLASLNANHRNNKS
jgi:hypothetical protein